MLIAAQAVNPVAGAAHQTVGVPSARRSGAHIDPAISVPGTARERISAAAVAEFFLKARAQIAGPLIGRGMRIAVMQDAHGPGNFAFLMAVQQFEKRNQRGRVLDRNIRSAGDLLEHAVVRRGPDFRGLPEGSSESRGGVPQQRWSHEPRAQRLSAAISSQRQRSRAWA